MPKHLLIAPGGAVEIAVLQGAVMHTVVPPALSAV
jgi:hypothetical protein